MRKRLLLIISFFLASSGAQGAMEDDPLLFTLMIDKLEWRKFDNGESYLWDADAWLGKDLNKAWFKTEGEHRDGALESAFSELFYSRAIAAYWDLQVGWRHDFEPRPERDWFAIGIKGLTPYFFEIDATLYAGGNGSVAGRLDAEYEILFTQRLILSPELEIDFFSKDDDERGIGSGFSSMELGLRLRYEIRRELAPYIGVNWETKLGDTEDIARTEGEPTDTLQFVAGIRAWF